MSHEFVAESVGWLASVVLFATIGRQVWTQWRTHTVAGVSRWLFVGQCFASLGFTVYSAMLGNVVFTVTNALMLANGVLGLWVDRRNRRMQPAERGDPRVRHDARVSVPRASSAPSSAR